MRAFRSPQRFRFRFADLVLLNVAGSSYGRPQPQPHRHNPTSLAPHTEASPTPRTRRLLPRRNRSQPTPSRPFPSSRFTCSPRFRNQGTSTIPSTPSSRRNRHVTTSYRSSFPLRSSTFYRRSKHDRSMAKRYERKCRNRTPRSQWWCPSFHPW